MLAIATSVSVYGGGWGDGCVLWLGELAQQKWRFVRQCVNRHFVFCLPNLTKLLTQPKFIQTYVPPIKTLADINQTYVSEAFEKSFKYIRYTPTMFSKIFKLSPTTLHVDT
jgi:hypothetical protein